MLQDVGERVLTLGWLQGGAFRRLQSWLGWQDVACQSCMTCFRSSDAKKLKVEMLAGWEKKGQVLGPFQQERMPQAKVLSWGCSWYVVDSVSGKYWRSERRKERWGRVDAGGLRKPCGFCVLPGSSCRCQSLDASTLAAVVPFSSHSGRHSAVWPSLLWEVLWLCSNLLRKYKLFSTLSVTDL